MTSSPIILPQTAQKDHRDGTHIADSYEEGSEPLVLSPACIGGIFYPVDE